MFFHNSLGVRLAHAVLSPPPGTLLRRFRLLRRDTNSSGGRWATASGNELRKQFRKWLTAAERADNSTPYIERKENIKVNEGTCFTSIREGMMNVTDLEVCLEDMFCTPGDQLNDSYSLRQEDFYIRTTQCTCLTVLYQCYYFTLKQHSEPEFGKWQTGSGVVGSNSIGIRTSCHSSCFRLKTKSDHLEIHWLTKMVETIFALSFQFGNSPPTYHWGGTRNVGLTFGEFSCLPCLYTVSGRLT